MIASDADADEGVARLPGPAAGEQVDSGQQQHDHPGIDQVAVDLLHSGEDRRRRLRVLGRHREEERVAKGRSESEHDREDVQEEQRSCSRGRRSWRRASAESDYLSRRDGAAARPSRLRGGARPQRGRRRQRRRPCRPTRWAGARSRRAWWERGRARRSISRGCSGEPSPTPVKPVAAVRRPPSGSGRSCWRPSSARASGRRSRRLARSRLDRDAVGRRVRRRGLKGRGLVVIAAHRAPAELRRGDRQHAGAGAEVGERAVRLAARLQARAAARGRAGWSGGRRCRRPAGIDDEVDGAARAAPPRRDAARAARRPGAACGSPASGRPSRRGPRWR